MNDQRQSYTGISKVFGTREEAIGAVIGFWKAVQSEEFSNLSATEPFPNEITSGDRTLIKRGLPYLPEQRGKWVVDFYGNHQALSQKALDYLNSLDNDASISFEKNGTRQR